MKTKAKFKIGDTFFHNEQKLFVIVDDVGFFKDKGYLYTLKCFKHEKDKATPWKRYYENRMLNELTLLKSNNTLKVLYGNK